MSKLIIPDEMLRVIHDQAEEEYPDECCGMVIGNRDDPASVTRVRRCRNVQDEYHEKDPERYPRKSKTAYLIDPMELLKIDRELRAKNEAIRVIYHSHIDVAAYFSEEDVRRALMFGEPIYPEADYLVLSVMET